MDRLQFYILIIAFLYLPFLYCHSQSISSQEIESIKLDAHLPPDMKLYLMAKTAVELNEGFEVDKRNRLKVVMDDCMPPSAPGN